MNDLWVVIAIIALLLFICIIRLVSKILVWRKAYKSEKIRQERILREGTPITARVTRVVLQQEHRQYEVFASWQSRETGRVFNFHETYMFPIGVRGFRPKIATGKYIPVRIIFDQPTHLIIRNW